jgi:hypothetical protein
MSDIVNSRSKCIVCQKERRWNLSTNLKQRPETTWFVWGDPQANGVISRNLGAHSSESEQADMTCFDHSGKERNLDLWECDFGFIKNLVKLEASLGFSIKVFRRQCANGKVTEAPRWLYDKTVKKPKKAKKVSKSRTD